jgi:WNK lysine deficient protein kinase
MIRELSRSILEGLQYLHGQPKPVIHRDIKCTNIFFANPECVATAAVLDVPTFEIYLALCARGEGSSKLGRLKIGDLGLATTMGQSVNGTPEFMAPEMYDSGYTCSVDIYAFGLCVLEMITRQASGWTSKPWPHVVVYLARLCSLGAVQRVHVSWRVVQES